MSPRRWTVEDACDESVALNDRQGLVNLLAALIPKTADPLESHLAAVRTFRFILTTNWDLLFEAAYRQIGQDYQVLSVSKRTLRTSARTNTTSWSFTGPWIDR